jgi:hypothetical protein
MLARFNAAATTVDLLTKRGEGWSDPFWLAFGIFLLFFGCGLYVYRKGMGPLSRLGLSRRQTEKVLAGSCNVLYCCYRFDWTFFV